MNVAIVGIGLIGGSFALCLREKGLAHRIVGIDKNEEHLQQALTHHLVQEATCHWKEGIEKADLIIVATPVDVTEKLLPSILDQIQDEQVVLEVGSTKQRICSAVRTHIRRAQFVASHPMWGTEHSGPLSARKDAFVDKVCILCESAYSSAKALDRVKQIYQQLGMKLIEVGNSEIHDMHLAYVSHISHISSFALANTVLEKEQQEEKILELASSGFETTVRLAKSNFKTWVPIFLQNKQFILEVLDEYIHQVQTFRDNIDQNNEQALSEQIQKSNQIKKILK